MKRNNLIALLVISLLLALTASMPYALSMPEAKIVWVSTQLNPPAEQAFVKGTLLPEFKSETGIDVEFVPISYADLSVRLEAEEKAGKVTIDLIGELHGGMDLFASKGYLQDLTKFGPLPNRTFMKLLEKYSVLHGIKAYIPWMTATYVMVVNKKAFKYLPEGLSASDVMEGTKKWDYNALLKWAKKLMEVTGEAKLGFPAGPKGLFHRFLHGYIYPSFTGAQVKKFDSDEAVTMWEYLKELWKYVHPASTTWDAMAEPLLREEVWIAWDHTARVVSAIRERPEDFVVVPVPRGPHGRGFILVVAGLAIPKGAPHPKEVWRLIEFLTRPKTQVSVLTNTGFFPTVEEAKGILPKGALRILVEGASKQLSSKDALVSMIPNLGPKGGEFVSIYREAFTRIVLRGEPIKPVISELGAKLLSLFKEVGAPLPPPDSG